MTRDETVQWLEEWIDAHLDDGRPPLGKSCLPEDMMRFAEAFAAACRAGREGPDCFDEAVAAVTAGPK